MAYSKYDSELPWPMVRAAQLLKYDPGDCDISVTTLIGPARIRLLKTHPDFVPTEDIQDKGYAFGGTIMHHMMQLAADPNSYIVFEKMKELFIDKKSPDEIIDEFKDLCAKMWGALQADRIETNRIVERRYYIERAGIKIGGQIDYTEPDMQLWDYKMMSVWEAIFGINFEKEAQANLYKHILREHDIHIESLHIAAFLRDWKLKDAESGVDKNYPVKQIISFPILMWEPERCEKFIQQRINAHYGQKELPLCSDSEVWHQKKRWAVMISPRAIHSMQKFLRRFTPL
jgi:hypothetical protein